MRIVLFYMWLHYLPVNVFLYVANSSSQLHNIATLSRTSKQQAHPIVVKIS